MVRKESSTTFQTAICQVVLGVPKIPCIPTSDSRAMCGAEIMRLPRNRSRHETCRKLNLAAATRTWNPGSSALVFKRSGPSRRQSVRFMTAYARFHVRRPGPCHQLLLLAKCLVDCPNSAPKFSSLHAHRPSGLDPYSYLASTGHNPLSAIWDSYFRGTNHRKTFTPMHRGTTPESAPLSILQKQALRRQYVMKHKVSTHPHSVFWIAIQSFYYAYFKICKYTSGVMLRYLFLGGWEAGNQHLFI